MKEMVKRAHTCDLIGDLQKKMAQGASSSAAPAAPNVVEIPAPSGGAGDGRTGSQAELPVEAVPILVLPSDALEVEEVTLRMKNKARKEPTPEEVSRRAAEGVSGGSVPAKKVASQADKGKKTGECSITDIKLRKLRLEVARKRSEMISRPIVEQVDRSPLNLYECMKVHSLLLAHLAACAQERASQTNRALQDSSAERESLIFTAREEAQRSVAGAEERVQAAIAERMSLELDLSGKLVEAQRVIESLDAEN